MLTQLIEYTASSKKSFHNIPFSLQILVFLGGERGYFCGLFFREKEGQESILLFSYFSPPTPQGNFIVNVAHFIFLFDSLKALYL